MTADTTPRFTAVEAVRIARELFGLSTSAKPLPSERDQNFVLDEDSGIRFVLKIAQSNEEPAVLDLQNAVLKHVAQQAPGVKLQRVIVSPGGEDLLAVTDRTGRQFWVRLLTWLDGKPLAKIPRPSEALLASLGETLAQLDAALQGFTHPAMYRPLQWDVKRADAALEHLSLLPSKRQALVKSFMSHWQRIDWSTLRHSLIHGDANDDNVLSEGDRLAGLLDFGDMVYSAVTCEPAVAIAYAMLGKERPLESALPILRAYHTRFALTPAEIDVVYPLATARLCLSVCYAAYNLHAKPDDPYQQVTAGRAWALLEKLSVIPAESVHEQFKRVCQTP